MKIGKDWKIYFNENIKILNLMFKMRDKPKNGEQGDLKCF